MDMKIRHSSDVPKKNTELDARDVASKTEEKIVKEDTEPGNDAQTSSGALKAWSYVLATFFMFISAW